MIWIYPLISMAWAVEIASVDRPSVGTSTYTLEKGGLQLESGLQIDASQSNSVYSLPTMLRIGISDQVELRPYTSIISSSQTNTLFLQSSGIQGKAKLYSPKEHNLAFSFLASSDVNAGSGIFLFDFWTDHWSMWINAGHVLTYDTRTGSSIVLAGVGYTFPKKHGLFIETSSTMEETATVTIEGGYTKTFHTFQVDVYALKDVHTSENWQVATGIGWRFR